MRAVELELIPALRSLGIGLIVQPVTPACTTARWKPPRPDASRMSSRTGWRRTVASSKRKELGRELAKPAHLALAWLLHNPAVSAAIVCAMTIAELRADLGALSVQLDNEAMARLDQIWSGPGGALQACAW